MPSGPCRLLIHAGIHGEEGETTVALSPCGFSKPCPRFPLNSVLPPGVIQAASSLASASGLRWRVR